jgi:hypothetical protein
MGIFRASHKNELVIPPDAYADAEAFEMLRVWAAGGDSHVTISSRLEGGAGGFGFMLANFAQHGARLYAQRDDITLTESLSQVLESFRDEIREQHGEISGSIPHDA